MKKKKYNNNNYDTKIKYHNKYIAGSKNTSAIIIKSYDLSLCRGG